MSGESNDRVLVLMMGLPRSGKSTQARILSKRDGAPIVNPDSIRLALHGQRFAALAEPFVWATAKVMVRALFLAGHETVIVDATNMTKARRDDWRSGMWRREIVHVATDAGTCIQRARYEGDEEIIPIIERMDAEFQPIDEAEIDGATSSPSFVRYILKEAAR